MRWSGLRVLLGLAPALAAGAAAATTPAEELLAAAIRYHDPGGGWAKSAWRLTFEETRPDAAPRSTVVLLDPTAERFEWRSERDGAVLEGELDGEGCELRLDGSTEFSDEERERHRLTCERLILWRDYYGYLWGLPMKLGDPGTILAPEVHEAEFDGRSVVGLKVTYESGVGDDTWYFYFDPETRALAGYRFYHDESANDGEYIHLSGEVEAGGVKLPRERTWYTHAADELLGTDTLVRLERLETGGR